MIGLNEETPQNTMSDSSNLNGSQRRRSPRWASPLANVKTDNKMALASVGVKRSITVRKIAPRKTVAPTEHNKENTPKRSASVGSQQKNPKISTPAPVPGRRGSSSAKKKKEAAVLSPILSSSPPARSQPPVDQPPPVPGRRGSSSAKKKKEAAVLSPILPSSPPAPSQPPVDPEDAVWSQKVRRSYSRLSEKSFNSPDSRETMFGFGQLKTPEVTRRVERSKTGLEVSSLSGLNSFTSLLEAEDHGSAFPALDPNIPGVTMVKEKRTRRKKVQQIGITELDALAAQMNAEFEEAEDFQLFVE